MAGLLKACFMLGFSALKYSRKRFSWFPLTMLTNSYNFTVRTFVTVLFIPTFFQTIAFPSLLEFTLFLFC
jgi:hypothetical protein